MAGEQQSTAQQVGRFLDGKAGRTKAAHVKGKETAENVFRVLGQYLKGSRSLYGRKMKDARQVFGLMDKDAGGTIDSEEFGKALKRLGFKLSPAQTQEVLGVVDADGSGEVDYSEFIKLLGMDFETEGRFVAYDPSKAERDSAVAAKDLADQMAPQAAQVDPTTHTQAVAYHLTAEQKRARAAEAVVGLLKEKLSAHWSLFGDELDGKLESFFSVLDRDGGGTVDAAELEQALRRLDLGLQAEQVAQLLASIDADGTGDIDLGELMARFLNTPVPDPSVRPMVSEATVGSTSASSIGTLEAPLAVREPKPPPVPASRLAFEDAMADAMSVLDAESARQKHVYSRAQAAADQMQFSARRTRLRPEAALGPGAMVSRHWPPVESARQTRRWNEGSDVHVEHARENLAQRLATPPSPRSTRSVCSARDPRGTGKVQTPRSGREVEKPLWGVLEWGQSRLFYPGPGVNPAQPPRTLPSGASMYSDAYMQQQSKDRAHLESRAVSFEAGEKGLKKAQFNSRTRFYEARDELIFTKGGLLGSDFGPSSKRLQPWTATGVVPRSSPHFRPGALPPQATPWQVHGKEEGFEFGVDVRQLGKDHPRLDNPLLDYRRDIVDTAQTARVIKHGSTPRYVRRANSCNAMLQLRTLGGTATQMPDLACTSLSCFIEQVYAPGCC